MLSGSAAFVVLVLLEKVFSVGHGFGGGSKVGSSDMESQWTLRGLKVSLFRRIICDNCDGATKDGCMLMLKMNLP